MLGEIEQQYSTRDKGATEAIKLIAEFREKIGKCKERIVSSQMLLNKASPAVLDQIKIIKEGIKTEKDQDSHVSAIKVQVTQKKLLQKGQGAQSRVPQTPAFDVKRETDKLIRVV